MLTVHLNYAYSPFKLRLYTVPLNYAYCPFKLRLYTVVAPLDSVCSTQHIPYFIYSCLDYDILHLV